MAKPDEGGLRIEYMRLDKIKRNKDNPKDHDLGALGESFRRFGFVMPMAINEETDDLLAGHGRLDKLEQGMIAGEEPPGRVRVDPADEMWMAPVIRGISMDEEDGKAYVVTDNRTTELGGWDDPLLAKVLLEVGGANVEEGLRGTGFDANDLDYLISTAAGDQDFFDGSTPDDTPEVPGADTKAYVVAVTYISFEGEDTFNRGLEALTFGERHVQRLESKYAQIDGERYLERWEAALSTDEEPDE